MLDVFNTFNQTKADIQFFYQDAVWTKPRGASFIYMMLIGGGGNGNGTQGGGSGAVTRWMGSAINVPDNLVIHPSTGNADNTTVSYRGTTLTTLLTANAATTNTAGTASTTTPFSASGFFASTAGSGGSGSVPAIPTLTFVMPGGAISATVTSNYGYTATAGSESYFMTQPIIVACGISASNASGRKDGAIGCGGSTNASSLGGRGLVIIASW
jgi:hypothetical protein